MHQRDTYKSPEDFLTDPSFCSWVRTGKDTQEWEEWTMENPARAALVMEARRWVLALGVSTTPMTQEEIHQAYQDTLSRIKHLEAGVQPTVVPLWRRLVGWGVAAVLGLGLLFGWLYQKPVSPSLTYTQLVQQAKEGLIEQTNHTRRPLLITLSDGSSVLLQPGSQLSYPKRFDADSRSVYLLGEAFFEVSKNPARPFLVYANEIVTQVVGTSFRVKAYADRPDVEVLVRTGKVKVASNRLVTTANLQGVTLLPNQGVRFNRPQLTFEKMRPVTQLSSTASSPNHIEQINFDFNDTSVSQIFATLEQAYQVEIEYPQEKLQSCYLTTSLSDQPLPEKLKIICESLGNNTRYELNGNKITLISNGCN